MKVGLEGRKCRSVRQASECPLFGHNDLVPAFAFSDHA